MKLPLEGQVVETHLDCSGHRRFTRSNRPGKSGATADEGPVRRQGPEGVAACSKRFYPVYSFSLILLLWRICHNGKGKAKSVIILIDLPLWLRKCCGNAPWQALVNHMGASMDLVLCRIARFPRV